MESTYCEVSFELEKGWLAVISLSTSPYFEQFLPIPWPIEKCRSSTGLLKMRDYRSLTPTLPSKLLLSMSARVSRRYLMVSSRMDRLAAALI
jgi:hypothetical protein